jgi:acyl carrier protein phosphodiesterase
MHGLGTFDEEKKHSILVDLGALPVRILALDRIIKSKETLGRPKDILTLPVLRDALATIKKRRASKTHILAQ